MDQPVYVTFEFRGNLEEEVSKVTLGIQGLRDESAKTYKRLLADSNEAYNGMSENNRKQAVSIQENIVSLRQLLVVQKTLDEQFSSGEITTKTYTEARARLNIQETDLRNGISLNIQKMNEQVAIEREATGSVVQLQNKLRGLIDTYNNLAKVQRESASGQNILNQIKDLSVQLQTANVALNQTGRNASAQFNSLGMSVQQVARELPAITMGANMFFLAISNNLPILADNIRQAKKEYAAFVAEGKKATPVWRQVVSSIFSWQTALVAAITLLTVYGKDIINWTKNLFKGGEAAVYAAEMQERLNKVKKEAIENSADEITKLKILYSTAKDATRNVKERTDAVKEMQGLYPSYLGNLSKEIILAGKAEISYQQLVKSLFKFCSLK